MPGLAELTPLISIVESRAHQYAGCAVQAFLVQGVDGWGLHFGRLEFTDTEPSYPADVDYGWCRAIAEFMPVDRGIKALRSVAEHGVLQFGKTEIALDGPPEMAPTYWNYRLPGYWPSDGSALGVRWACNIALLRQRREPHYSTRYGPLVARDAPLYPDFDSMIRHRAGAADVGGSTYLKNVAVVVPNFEARIARVTDVGTALTLGVEARHGKLSDLVLKVYARTDEVFHDEVDLGAARLPYRREFSARTTLWNAVLLRKGDSGVIDYRHSYGVEQPTDVDLANLDEERLKALVSGGENTFREFKLYPRDDNQKRDVAQSAVAFANAQGGVIFVGVRDDTTIEGVERGDENALVSSLLDRSDPPIKVTVYSVPVGAKFVYAIHVPPSTSRPHFLVKEQIVFVRAGSSDRRATRDEVIEMVRSSDPGHLLLEGR